MHDYGGVNPKVTAATGGAGVGSAAGILTVYIAERISGDMPIQAELATVVLVTAAATFVAGWIKKGWPRPNAAGP